MADNRDNDSLVKDLIQTVQDLSQRLIPRNETINNEVSRLFGRGRDVKPSSTSTNPAADSNGAAHNEVLSRFRRLNNNRRIGQSLIPKRRKPKQPNTTPFMCDVILLSGPKDSIVPRQGVKLALAERGHVLTGCRFHKAMTEVNVETAIHEAFGSIIPLLVDIEILHSVHNALLKPVLSPGQQGIDGAILHRLFKVKNKPIYVRPSKIIVPELAQENEAEKSKDQLSFNVVEDTDNEDSDDVLTPVLLNSSTQVPSSSNGSQPTLASMSTLSTLARTSTATSHPTLASTSTATSQSTLASTSAATSQSTLASTSTATSQSTLASTSTATSQSTLASTSTATSQSTLASTSAATSQSTLASTSTATNTPHHVTQAIPDYSQDVPDFVDISADDDTMDMTVKEVVIFRSNIRKDVLEVFSDPAILRCHLCVTVMDAAGRAEKGIGKGVILDVLTQFWQDFFLGLAVGGKEKIPYIRHDLQSPQWQSVARVLVYGYNKLSYFPLALSKLFLCTCLFGEDAITPEFLLSSFKDYIPSADQEVLDMCLSEEFDPQSDEVLDFLGTFKCFKMPTKETIKTIISEIAHQELVQKPRYILSSWAPILAQLKQDVSFTTVEAIDGLYKAKEATPKKIISLLKVDPKNEAERQTLAHLKRFIKSLEAKPLQRFLHFCTGSNVISCEGIDITFTDMSGFGRHPVVHTCGPLLEIPCTYESYPELVEEFTNVMKDDQAWAFDIA